MFVVDPLTKLKESQFMNIYMPSTEEMLRPEYLRELSKVQQDKRAKIRKIDIEYSDTVKALQNKYAQEPRKKDKVTNSELIDLIGMVLDSGNSGSKVIKAYASNHNKADQWRKDIAKPIAGKPFESALEVHANHPIMISIKKTHAYCEEIILKQTVTGALNLLSKHVRDNRVIEKLKLEIGQLKEMLAIKDSLVGKSPDWGLGQELRNQGKTIRVIADILGVSKSAVSKNTKPRQK
jgi:hypothetical protein